MQKMMYLFPFDKVAPKSKVIIYGTERAAKEFVDEVDVTGYCTITACIHSGKGKRPKTLRGKKVISPEQIMDVQYDSIVISLDNPQDMRQAKESVEKFGVDEKCIVLAGENIVYPYKHINNPESSTMQNDDVMLYLFPFGDIPPKSKVIIYGAGDVGRQFLGELETVPYCKVIAVADRNEDYHSDAMPIISPERIPREKFDYVVIAINNAMVVNSVKKMLQSKGVPEEKIIDASWRYAAPKRKTDGGNRKGKKGKKNTGSRALSYLETVRGMWLNHAETGELLKSLRQMYLNDAVWKKESNELWIIYISLLLEENRVEEAKEVLLRYIHKYYLKDIAKSALVSEFAFSMGYINRAITATQTVWKILKHNTAKEEFIEYLKGKTIAVVGNAGTELGKGNGKEIDSHDIVIRFNNYPLEGYEVDYGTKTDVWVRVGNNEVEPRSIRPYKFVILEPDISRSLLRFDVVDLWVRYLECFPNKIFYMDREFKTKMREETGLYNPSSGCRMIYLLYKVLGSLENVNLYGFSLLSEGKNYGHYYDNLCQLKNYHPVTEEEILIKKLYGIYQEKKKRPMLYVTAYQAEPVEGGTKKAEDALRLQQRLVGSRFRNFSVRYLLRAREEDSELSSICQGVHEKLHELTAGADFVVRHPDIKESLNRGDEICMICHDMGTAYGAYLMGMKYILVYHGQGSIIGECSNSATSLDEDELRTISFMERMVFLHAWRVYFPTHDARKLFLETTSLESEILEKVPFGDISLEVDTPWEDGDKVKSEREILQEMLSAAFHPKKMTDVIRDNYLKIMAEFVKDDSENCLESTVNQRYLLDYKDKYAGKSVVICGAGSSLDCLKEKEPDTMYIALNRALFYEPISFDFLFMQDYPKDGRSLEDYNSYDCIKFYGIITNPSVRRHLRGMGGARQTFQQVTNEIRRYELAPVWYDYHSDSFEFDIDKHYIADAQSVLFSALQFAVFAGFKNIYLCGVEFSDKNYGDKENPSRYARNVGNNLVSFKHQLMIERPDIQFSILHSGNEWLKDNFRLLDRTNLPVTVTGIYTWNYRSMLRLQMDSCKDDYGYDFVYISDEKWEANRGNDDFPFYGGNILKVDAVVQKIQEYWGEIILVADADLVFFQETKSDLLRRLGNKDMLFLQERRSNAPRFERAVANINIGFVLIRCNQTTLTFWQKVREEVLREKGWDQEIVNNMIKKGEKISFAMLPDTYLNGGQITKSNLKNQHICTGCGIVANKWGQSKVDFLAEALERYRIGEWFEQG